MTVMKSTRLAFAFFGAALTAPVAQAEVVTPPNCTPKVTISKASCVTTTVFDCGDRYEEHGYVNGELVDTHLFTKDWALLGYALRGDAQEMTVLMEDGHSITLAQLLSEGKGTTQRKVTASMGRLKDLPFKLEASATLTDRTVDLSGNTFQIVELTRVMTRANGANPLEFKFDVLVSEELDLFIEGKYTRATSGAEPELKDYTPLALHFPGEPGFMADRPQEGCDG